MTRVLLLVALLALLPSAAYAQGDYGSRLSGANGWALPVATKVLCSDEEKHVGRGSVNAWDLCAPLGSAIYAMAPGVVEYAGCNNAGGYGCWVLLNHADGYSSSYGHMISGSITVQRGQRVDATTLLGQVGWTGKTSFGPHTHFEIRHGGQFIRIDQFFNIAQMRQCNLCSVNGAPVAASGILAPQVAQPPAQAAPTNRLTQLLHAVALLPAEQLSSAVFMLTLLVGFVLWLGGMWVRIVLVSAGSAMAGALVIALLLAPVTVQANQATPTVSGDWEKAYQVTQGREGWKCTNDGAYTMGGVTQGTYNRWRAKHGNGPADVCANLTREQAKAVFYELFWQPIGADRLPFALALSAVDHYYNTGKVSHLLAQCGQDVRCFNQARIADYRTKSNCYRYCVAWINRVNHIRTLTEK